MRAYGSPLIAAPPRVTCCKHSQCQHLGRINHGTKITGDRVQYPPSFAGARGEQWIAAMKCRPATGPVPLLKEQWRQRRVQHPPSYAVAPAARCHLRAPLDKAKPILEAPRVPGTASARLPGPSTLSNHDGKRKGASSGSPRRAAVKRDNSLARWHQGVVETAIWGGFPPAPPHLHPDHAGGHPPMSFRFPGLCRKNDPWGLPRSATPCRVSRIRSFPGWVKKGGLGAGDDPSCSPPPCLETDTSCTKYLR